jgi:carbamoyltransferase
MFILGLNAFHGDSSACIVKDGELLAAIEEERLRRVKHWAGLPVEAVRFCLDLAGITLDQVDRIGVSRDPRANFWKKVGFAVTHGLSPRAMAGRARNLGKVKGGVAEGLGAAFDMSPALLRKKIVGVEHHRAHIASAFLVSPFDDAAVLSVDGMGDFVSTMWGAGHGNRILPAATVEYPHSLGFLYTALTQYLGFWKYGDEYKVMGLSGFGTPRFLPELRKLIRLMPDGGFQLNLRYFAHRRAVVGMSWEGGEPVIGRLFSEELERLLGPARRYEDPITRDHENIAASLQALYEEVFFHILEDLHRRTGLTKLAFAGGCAQNSLANGRIYANSAFQEVYVPPAGHDAGTAIGAAFYIWNQVLGNRRGFEMRSPFWGMEFGDAQCKAALDTAGLAPEHLEDDELFPRVARLVADGNIVGWYQGRTEWGPRALGDRSIVANPAFPEIKERMNLKIKKREPFRPFAPSVLEEAVGDYFESHGPVPFMEKVYVIRKEVRDKIPAVVHVDGTGRLQTVSRDVNPRYHRLIEAVGKLTGVPMVLNTSFNENEPIVNRPEEAIDCFLRTKMDALVLGNYLVERKT